MTGGPFHQFSNSPSLRPQCPPNFTARPHFDPIEPESTIELENQIQASIDEQHLNDRKETERILEQLEKNNDKCLEDAFGTAQKLKEIRSGRLSLDSAYDKKVEEELDEF